MHLKKKNILAFKPIPVVTQYKSMYQPCNYNPFIHSGQTFVEYCTLILSSKLTMTEKMTEHYIK